MQLSLSQWIALCVLILLQTSCGFQLKGEVSLPKALHSMAVEESDDDVLNNLLKRQLKTSAVQLHQAEFANVILNIEYTQPSANRVAQSSSSDLKIIRLDTKLEYSLRTNKDEWLIESKTIRQSREFESSDSQLLGKSSEQNQLYKEMKSNLVRILIYQLRFYQPK